MQQERRTPLSPEVCLKKLEESVSLYPVPAVGEALARFLENPVIANHRALRRATGLEWHPDRQAEGGQSPNIGELNTLLDDLTNPNNRNELVLMNPDPIAAQRVRTTIRVAKQINYAEVIVVPLNKRLDINEIVLLAFDEQTPSNFEISINAQRIEFRADHGLLGGDQFHRTICGIRIEIIVTNEGQRLLVIHNASETSADFSLIDKNSESPRPAETFQIPVSRSGSTSVIPVETSSYVRSGSTAEIDPSTPRRGRPSGRSESNQRAETQFSEIFPTNGKLLDLSSSRASNSTKSGFMAKLSATIGFKSSETPENLTVHNGEVGGVLFETISFSRDMTLRLGRESVAISIRSGVVNVNGSLLSQGRFMRFGNLEVGLRVIPPAGSSVGKSIVMIRHSVVSSDRSPITVS